LESPQFHLYDFYFSLYDTALAVVARHDVSDNNAMFISKDPVIVLMTTLYRALFIVRELLLAFSQICITGKFVYGLP
jgi:hypothetical protein